MENFSWPHFEKDIVNFLQHRERRIFQIKKIRNAQNRDAVRSAIIKIAEDQGIVFVEDSKRVLSSTNKFIILDF